MLDFRLLTFLDLCHTNSYTKTADNLSITQPAVSQHIRYLEQYYGKKLILYQNRHFSLTKEGEYLFKEVTKLQIHSKKILQNIQHLSEEQETPVISIGSNPTIGEFILPGLISSYTAQEPDCRIRSFIGSTKKLEQLLHNGDINILITDSIDAWPEFERHPFRSEPVCCVCNPSHPLAEKTISLNDLKSERIVYREKASHAYYILQKSFQRMGYDLDTFNIPYEAGSMHSIIQYLKEGLAISFLYRCAVQKYLDNGELNEIYLSELHDSVDFYYIYPQSTTTSSHAKQFLQFCLEQQKKS